MITVIILNYNDKETTIKLWQLINEYSAINNIVIVDNCSTDDSFLVLKKFENHKTHVIKTKKNGGYGYGNNYGAFYAINILHSETLLIANPDVIFTNKCLINMQLVLNEKQCGIVSCFMKNTKGEKSESTAWKIPTFMQYLFSNTFLGKIPKKIFKSDSYEDILEWDKPTEVDCVAGSMFMISSDVIKKYGLFDENIFLYCEETSLGIKMKKNNVKLMLLANESYIHMHSISINKCIKAEIDKIRLMWKSRLYVLENYYDLNKLQIVCSKLISKINLLEYRLYYLIKNGGK